MDMKRQNNLNRTSGLATVMALAALALAGCNRAAPPAEVQQAPTPTAALALSTDPLAPPLVNAPPANALPSAPPVRIGRLRQASDRYAFSDRGYEMSDTFADAPPDYTFDYDGVRPWVWVSDDQYEQVVEPSPGGDRYYYYRPGDDQPFLVRDPDYSYGYEGGELVVVYDHDGRPLPDQYVEQRADLAGRYLARARSIYEASRRQQHEAVAAANWRARSGAMDSERNQWGAAQNQDAGWRSYHTEHLQDEQGQWEGERYRREAEAARYATQANDTQAAARFTAAALTALQVSRAHGQAPGYTPQGGQARAAFGQPPQGPAQQFGQGQRQAQGPVQGPPPGQPRGQGRGPGFQNGPTPNPAAPGQPAIDRRASDRAAAAQGRQQQPAVDTAARARASQQAAAQQQAATQQQAQAQQARQTAQRNQVATTQARATQQAAAQQQAQAQRQAQAAQRDQAAATQAHVAQQAAAQQAAVQQQARAEVQQQASQRAAAQAQAAAQRAAEQQVVAQRQAQASAMRTAPPREAPKPPPPPVAQARPPAPAHLAPPVPAKPAAPAPKPANKPEKPNDQRKGPPQ